MHLVNGPFNMAAADSRNENPGVQGLTKVDPVRCAFEPDMNGPLVCDTCFQVNPCSLRWLLSLFYVAGDLGRLVWGHDRSRYIR